MTQSADVKKELVDVLFQERRRDRRWRNIRFFVGIVSFIIFLSLLFTGESKEKAPESTFKNYVAMVRLNGMIAPGQSFSARMVLPQLERAFADKKAKGVLLLINSPGGSPVQSSIIHDKIVQLKKRYHKKVIVMGQDMLTSGAYMVAVAADKIYVHPDTITGSIGVIMQGFGFSQLIKRFGVTRRVFTAGLNKDRLDPFQPLKSVDKAKIQSVLLAAHQNFITMVKQSRAGHLRGSPRTMFSGDFWLGVKAKQLGLVDGVGDRWQVLNYVFKTQHVLDYTRPPSLLDRFLKGMAAQVAVHLGMNAPKHTLEALP